jgi:outer membrane protein OmpA-like peptidoglycan-associated protein
MKTLHNTLASALAGLICVAAPPAALAQSANTRLSAPDARITDEAIQADQRAYEQLQGRIKGINDKGRPVRDYFLSKAQCWLDVSFHEYTRNDRSSFPQEAMTESEKLIVGMERGDKLDPATPLVGQAVKIRPDLWDKASALKTATGFECAQHKVACAEIELVHAGNEHAQQQWRHAKPYVQIAEDLMAEAEALARDCPGKVSPAVVEAPPPPPPPPPVPMPQREAVLVANVVFNFDRHEESEIRSPGMEQLKALIERAQANGLQPVSVRISGHADALNSTGQSDYNQQLSARRAATVKAILVRLGVDAGLINVVARGDLMPVSSCPREQFRSAAALQECLLPDRRVEIEIQSRNRP